MHIQVNRRHRLRIPHTRTLSPYLLLGLAIILAACRGAASTPTLYAVGQTAEVDGWQITVHSFSTVPGDEWRQPAEGHVFCVVELTLKNASNQIRFVMPEQQMQLLDSAGRAFALDYEAGVMAARLRQWFVPQGTIEVGQELHGGAAYQIPAGSHGLRWVFRSSLFPWANKAVFLVEEPLPPHSRSSNE